MKPKPNIIFIMADDHASRAISCYGAGINETPNIDRIADEGIRLNHCYVTNSICTPSRAAILTGTYNHVNCVFTLQTPINNRMPNVAKHLRTGNYQTAVIGKWHLGEGKEHEPTGFDFWSVLPGQGEYFDPYMIEMGETIEVPGYATDIITEKSLNWLKTRDTEKPFFFYNGTITAFGSNLAQVTKFKVSGSNNISTHRVIGTNPNIEPRNTAGSSLEQIPFAGSRNPTLSVEGAVEYECDMEILVSDPLLWHEFRTNRAKGYSEPITLHLVKGGAGVNREEVRIIIDDYIIAEAPLPIPEDKGVIRSELKIKPRHVKVVAYDTLLHS